MQKSILTLILFIITSKFLSAQTKDTTVYYYRYLLPHYEFAGSHRVSTLDSADYYRVIIPPDSGQVMYSVREFYKNGRPKFIATAQGNLGLKTNEFLLQEAVPFQGQSISYYYNGKRRLISNYNNGRKEGMEYVYSPLGKLYCVKKYEYGYHNRMLLLECYDLEGNQIAKDGNGHWIAYDTEFKNVFLQGEVKNGLREGTWEGNTNDSDSIKFKMEYKKGKMVSGKSFDKSGREYTFEAIARPPYYKNGTELFMKRLSDRIVIPKDANGEKIRDTVSVSFIIEKDGHLTNFLVVGQPNPLLGAAALDAAKKSSSLEPRTYYGIPIRSQITIRLNLKKGYWDSPKMYEKILDIKFIPPDEEYIK